MAATISVDDDGQDCPAAAHSSIQAAVNAAAAGDTVAICPGTYDEGTGLTGTNALTITKSLTLKGAGADLVRIRPYKSPYSMSPYAGISGQIAENNNEFDIRNGVGDIIVAKGTTSYPIGVDISGVTVDGNGVFVEAGVVYIDAGGTLFRNRITNVVTSEAATAYNTIPGGWRGPQPGYGIAQVTAATTTPAGATPRQLVINNTRVDRYNRAGVFSAGLGTATTEVDNRASMNASEVVGRVLCQNFAADGNCAAPGLVTTGPLFGQDGIRLTDRARGTVQNSSVTQNLVNGTGAPVRQTWSANGQTMTNPGTSGNANLRLGAGIRLLGADPANSLITKNNIVDNAYGVINDATDGVASAVAVPAPNNFWGLRFTPAPGGGQMANTGPLVSPAFNPPVPENPVNGTEITDAEGRTSTAVDFSPYRSGPQSDPLSGQFPNIQAPMPVSDAGPTVSLAASDDTLDRGQTVTFTATAADDFGVKRVTFYSGGAVIGSDALPPYTQAFTVPADATCTARTFTAVAEDSLGQTAAGNATVTVVGPNNCQPAENPPGNPPANPPGNPPAGPPANGGGSITEINGVSANGSEITVTPKNPAGVAKVEWFLGNRLVCTDTTSPFTCTVTPGAADVGLQSLRVVITDKDGTVTVVSRQVIVNRFRSRGVSVKITKARVRGGKIRRTITATVLRPIGMSAAEACSDSSLTLVISRRNRPFSNTQPSLDRTCAVRLRFTAPRSSKAIYAVSARFAGNTVLLPVTKSRRFS